MWARNIFSNSSAVHATRNRKSFRYSSNAKDIPCREQDTLDSKAGCPRTAREEEALEHSPVEGEGEILSIEYPQRLQDIPIAGQRVSCVRLVVGHRASGFECSNANIEMIPCMKVWSLEMRD